MTVKSYVEIDNMYNKFVEIDSDSDYDHDDDQYNSDSELTDNPWALLTKLRGSII